MTLPKGRRSAIALFCVASLTSVFSPSSSVLAQGPLTPPGAPAPTMKTLDQLDAKLEKRTPISSAPITISASGSYYLTGNLSVASGNGIVINGSHVTLDLNGFTISSTASPAAGIAVILGGTLTNITIKNGNIRGTTTFAAGAFTTGGFLDGITNASLTSSNLRISEVSVSGMGDDGIDLTTTTVPTFVVERCTVSVCAGYGIQAGVIRDCTVDITGDHAIFADVATNCSGETVNTASVTARGVYGVNIMESCRGIAVSGVGVYGTNVSNSRGTSMDAIGLSALNATNCVGTSTDGAGLNATNATNCHGVSSSGIGLIAANATNCTGTSSLGIGLSATSATNCFGASTSGLFGIDATPGTASFCRGQRTGGTAITAGIAIGCTVASGTVNSLNKFLGTP